MKKTILISWMIFMGAYACAQSIVVKSPNNNEKWRKGVSHDIIWESSGITSGTYKITLWQAGVSKGTIATGLDTSLNLFKWTVGNVIGATLPPGSGYKVKVRVQGEPVSDSSDLPFSILPQIQAQERPPLTLPETPQFSVYRSPELVIRDLTYDYRNNRFEAWVRNTGNAPFVGRFRWEWHTLCGSRAAYKDIPPNQSAVLERPEGMHFSFDCNPPLHQCAMEAHFSIAPRTQDGKNLPSSQADRDLPRYEHTQFLMRDRHVMLRFLNGSVHLNAGQGHTITRDNAYDSNADFTTATFRVVVGIRNCGGEAGTADQWPARGLYWSAHHWPSNSHTMPAHRYVSAGHITSLIAPGQGISLTRSLTLPIRSGRYELRFHLGPNWMDGQVCSFYLSFADNLIH